MKHLRRFMFGLAVICMMIGCTGCPVTEVSGTYAESENMAPEVAETESGDTRLVFDDSFLGDITAHDILTDIRDDSTESIPEKKAEKENAPVKTETAGRTETLRQDTGCSQTVSADIRDEVGIEKSVTTSVKRTVTESRQEIPAVEKHEVKKEAAAVRTAHWKSFTVTDQAAYDEPVYEWRGEIVCRCGARFATISEWTQHDKENSCGSNYVDEWQEQTGSIHHDAVTHIEYECSFCGHTEKSSLNTCPACGCDME